MKCAQNKRLETALEFIAKDPIYLACLRLAMQSKSDQERYGSVMMSGDVIIGRGYNRRISGLNRKIRQGYANHAEIEALNDAIMHGNDVAGAHLYVAGYFVEEGSLFLRDRPVFTCLKCPSHLSRYSIGEILIPGIDGWIGMTPQRALESASDFTKDTHKKRKAWAVDGCKIEDISHLL